MIKVSCGHPLICRRVMQYQFGLPGDPRVPWRSPITVFGIKLHFTNYCCRLLIGQLRIPTVPFPGKLGIPTDPYDSLFASWRILMDSPLGINVENKKGPFEGNEWGESSLIWCHVERAINV